MLKFSHWLVLIGLTPSAWAEVVVEPAQPLTHRVQVQPIRVKKTTGETAATFGDAAAETYIKQQINRIYAQIGVRIDWLPVNEYTNDFAYDGSPGNYNSASRPSSHLDTIINSAGIPPKSSNAIVLNMFFIEIVPFFSKTAENVANGYAYLDANGSTMQVGTDLLAWGGSAHDVIARVIAHELGHNLGLDHYTLDSANLMASGGSTGRLVASQKTTVFTNNAGTDGFDFLQALPPPTNYSTWASNQNVTGPPDGDDDLDGVKNIIEFMFQTPPKASSQLPQPVAAANGLTWTLPKHAPAVADGIVYRVTTSDALVSWLPAGSDSGRSTVLQNDASALVVRLLSGGSRRFMRLDIQIPANIAAAEAATFIPAQTPLEPPQHAGPGDIMTFTPP